MTPARRVAGREITTLEGLDGDERDRWAAALSDRGGSQCGFCTPGIVMRLAALAPHRTGTPPDAARVDRALVAHLCRCTGWQTVVEAAELVYGAAPGAPPDAAPVAAPVAAPAGLRDLGDAGRRATLEGGEPQRVGPDVALGGAGFADDTAPRGALVAVPDRTGGYVTAPSVRKARAVAGAVPGRSTTAPLTHPLAVPAGTWTRTLATTWLEPAYLEPDASWCEPGGNPAPACANGGAFGGKRNSPVPSAARRLADEHHCAVRVLWSREDAVRLGPKRPPVAGGVRSDGTGALVVAAPAGGYADAAWEALVERVGRVAPGLVLEPREVDGPPVSLDLRGAVWAEAAALSAASGWGPVDDAVGAFDRPVEVTGPSGGWAVATWRGDGSVDVEVEAGPPLDEVVLRSYCIGAVHQAVGMVRSEGIAVDADGAVCDLTVRSFGILAASAMPRVRVTLRDRSDRDPVNGSDAVFAATAAACWLSEGLPGTWPTRPSDPRVRRTRSGRRS